MLERPTGRVEHRQVADELIEAGAISRRGDDGIRAESAAVRKKNMGAFEAFNGCDELHRAGSHRAEKAAVDHRTHAPNRKLGCDAIRGRLKPKVAETANPQPLNESTQTIDQRSRSTLENTCPDRHRQANEAGRHQIGGSPCRDPDPGGATHQPHGDLRSGRPETDDQDILPGELLRSLILGCVQQPAFETLPPRPRRQLGKPVGAGADDYISGRQGLLAGLHPPTDLVIVDPLYLDTESDFETGCST